MDASLSGGCSAQGVSLQVEASGSAEAGHVVEKQGSSGGLNVQATATPIVGSTESIDGSSRMPSHVSQGVANEDSRLISPNGLVSALHISDTGEHENWKKGHGMSLDKRSTEYGAQREDGGERYGLKSVAKDAPQVRVESQLPMRQLARKGGILKGEAASASKTVSSVADAVKEGILKKERQEQGIREALEAVMAIHGRRREVPGHAALFPGVTGPESGRLCHCCNRPETLKSTIFCDKCERGFHVDCVKHWPTPAHELDVWHCGPCGLQPGHYWPLGRVLISYDNAVAEYQKHSSKFLTSMQEDPGFGAFALGMDQKTHEKSNGVEASGTKVKVIRDFKKEARKGAAKGSLATAAIQPFVSNGGYVTLKESGMLTGLRSSAQSKTPGYPEYVSMQSQSAAPSVNTIVQPEASAIRTSPSSKAHLSGSLSTHSTPTQLYKTGKDFQALAGVSSQFECQKTSVMNQYVASPQPNVIGPSNTDRISFQQTAVPASGTFYLEVSSSEELRPYVLGERLTEREELLREAKESLKQLQTFISGLQGKLPEEWRVVLRRKPTGAQEKYYLSPAKRKYRSRQDVARFLGLVHDPRLQKTKSSVHGLTTIESLLAKNDISASVRQAVEVRKLPMFCGDVMIEKLGVIDPRSTYSDDHHIWPVGFLSSYHDPETGSYCISTVEDGGDLGPIFRVTRKLVIGPASTNDDLLASSSKGNSPLFASGVQIKVNDDKSSVVESALGGAVAKAGDHRTPVELIKLEDQKQHTENSHKHLSKLEGPKEPGNVKDRMVLLGNAIKEGGEIANSNPSLALSKDRVVHNRSIIDLTDEREQSEVPHSETTLDYRVSAVDVRTDPKTANAGKEVGCLGDLRASNHQSIGLPVVIDLSDEEDDKSSRLMSREKGPGPCVESVGLNNDRVADVTCHKPSGFQPSPIKPLPNILMEEFTVEARSTREAWRLFSKQFVENCKKSLGSGINCTVPILKATNDYVIFHSGTFNLGEGGTGGANSALLSQNSIDRRETTRALFYEKLEKRLGEDRFGLDLPEVQKMIRASHIGKSAADDKAWVKGVDQIVEAARTAALLSPSMNDPADNSSGPWKRRKRKDQLNVTAEECVKKPKSSSTEPLVLSQALNFGAGEQLGIEKVIFRSPSAVVVPSPASVPFLGPGESFAPTTIAAPVPPPVVIVEEPRQPPPAGQPVLKRLPSELVGDLLQVWEFLCRFSDLFGHEVRFTLEDLETGLMDGTPAKVGPEVTTRIKDSTRESGEKENADAVVVPSERNSTAGRGETNVTDPEESGVTDPMNKSNQPGTVVDNRQESTRVPNVGRSTDLNVAVEPHSGAAGSLSQDIEDVEREEKTSEDLKCQRNVPENLDASQGGQTGTMNAAAFSDQSLGKSLALLAEAHIPILRFLASDLKFRVLKGLHEDAGDEPKKRGRKRLSDIGALPPELGDDLPMNAMTWPEVAHRYLVAILDVKRQGEMADLAPEDRKKIVRYFEGDGGVMGGAVEGVVGVESDAQVLAEAEKELTLRMPKTVEKEIVIFVPQEWDVALTPINPAPKGIKSGKTGDNPEVLPKWVEALEPVRKMPTNLGTKLKNQVQVSLDLNPPDWAKATLEWSLSKGTFKSNAAGTTKRAVLEVLAQYHGEELKAINAPRIRKVKAAPSAEHLMQRCRIVLREVAKADSKQVFSNLAGGAFATKSNRDAEPLSRPLDFRTIDARLAAGAYGGSTDAFAADMRQVWKNVEEVHKSGSAILELANNLSQLFEKLYVKQVISLIKGVPETKDREKEKAAGVDGSGKRSSNRSGMKVSGNAADDKLGKAPWEDDTTCRVCGIDEDYDSILLCDGCDAEYHIYCLVPPLEKVPKGNWFCPSCVAVEEGFPEAPSLGEAELAALEEKLNKPVVGSILKLEYEDEKAPSAAPNNKQEPQETGRVLSSGTKSEVEAEGDISCKDSDSQPPAVESTMEALLKELEEKEYWQLSLSDKLFLLKFLCDEALKTPPVRAHLEKSVEVALELQQQLRDSVAERLKIVIPVDSAKSAEKETLQKPQITSQQRPDLDATQAREGASAGAPAGRLALLTSEVALPSGDDGVVLRGDSMSETKPQESVLGISKVVHDLDLNVEAGKEPESDNLLSDHKVLSGTSPVGIDKDRPSVKEVEGTRLHESDPSKIPESGDFGSMHSGNGSIDHKQGVLKQDEELNDGKKTDLVTSIAEGVEGNASRQPDTALKPLNPLKRGLEETVTSDTPNTLIDGPDNLKKAKKGETVVKSTSPGERNGQTESSDGEAIPGKESEDSRVSALRSARALDAKITKLSAKLFNLSLRREHMGIDHLGRHYWALAGVDGRPCLVVADMASVSQDQTGEGVEDQNASKPATENKRNDGSDLRTVDEGTKWIHYKGDKALDELVKWLSPRCQHERVLRMAIYHWRRSLYSRQLLEMPDMAAASSGLCGRVSTEPSNVVDEFGAARGSSPGEETGRRRNMRNFPAAKATRLLQRRHAAPGGSGVDENDDVLKRCECLELLWTSRYHCPTCHETYESTAELQTHSNDCPTGSKPSPENVAKETPSQAPPKPRKSSQDGSKGPAKTKKLSSHDRVQDPLQSAGKGSGSERTRRSVKREGSQPAADDDVDMEPAEAVELLPEYVENVQAPVAEGEVPVQHTASNGLLKALEEWIEPSSVEVVPQAPEQAREGNEALVADFSVDDRDGNALSAKFGFTSGQQVEDGLQKPGGLNSNQSKFSNNWQSSQNHGGGWVDGLNTSNRTVREVGVNVNQFSNSQGGQGNSGGWANDLNMSDQQLMTRELYSQQARNGEGDSGGWANDWSMSSRSFTDEMLSSNRLDSTNTAHGASGGWANDVNMATQSFREDSYGYHPPAPAMIAATQASQGRVSQMGFSDRGQSCAPPIQNSFVFDMMPSSPDYPSMDGFPSLESSNPAASQQQQFIPPRNAPVAYTSFPLSPSDTKPVPYNQYLAPSGHSTRQPLSFQQMLASQDPSNAAPSVYPSFLLSTEPANTAHLSFTDLLQSRFPQPGLYPQHSPAMESMSLNQSANSSFPSLSYTNPCGVRYGSLISSFSPSGARQSSSNPSLYTNPPASRHAGLQLNSGSKPPVLVNANSSPLFSSNPPARFPVSNSVVEPETRKSDVGRFNTNSWFDSQSAPEPVERPAVIPTKPTARRSSTWDYLINLPLPSRQGNVGPVQRRQSSMEAGSSPFDLMFEKPQREDLNMSTGQALEGQQPERRSSKLSRDVGSSRAECATVGLMLEKQEQERGVLPEAAGASEGGSLSIDLMCVPGEHREVLPGDTMGTAGEACMEAPKESWRGDDCVEAAGGSCEGNGQIECSGTVNGSFEAVIQVDATGACVGDAEIEAELDKQGEAGKCSEETTISVPTVAAAGGSAGRKPVKRFPVVSSSLRPLMGEHEDVLRGLKISLLDMEAALATDMVESCRAVPVRRRAWRSFVKSASCIYEVTKATILLEVMVQADCLKPYWGLWSSLSAAARSSSLSSLALRVFALDAAITYERVKAPGEGKEVVKPGTSMKTKKKKPSELQLPPPPKKKKKK